MPITLKSARALGVLHGRAARFTELISGLARDRVPQRDVEEAWAMLIATFNHVTDFHIEFDWERVGELSTKFRNEMMKGEFGKSD